MSKNPLAGLPWHWVYVGFKHQDTDVFLGGVVVRARTFDEAINRVAVYGIRAGR